MRRAMNPRTGVGRATGRTRKTERWTSNRAWGRSPAPGTPAPRPARSAHADTGRAMTMENVRVVKCVLAASAAFVVVLALSASAGAAPVTPFRKLAVLDGALHVHSDGRRFAWATNKQTEVVRVFDT